MFFALFFWLACYCSMPLHFTGGRICFSNSTLLFRLKKRKEVCLGLIVFRLFLSFLFCSFAIRMYDGFSRQVLFVFRAGRAAGAGLSRPELSGRAGPLPLGPMAWHDMAQNRLGSCRTNGRHVARHDTACLGCASTQPC